MMHMSIHETLIPNMLEGMSNDTTKAKLLENYGLTFIFKDTVGEWLVNLGFKCDYSVNNYYVGRYEKKDTIWYRWEFIGCYLILERCMFKWVQVTDEDSETYKGYKSKRSLQDQA